jgi:phosphonate transport system permease protein
MSTKYLVLIIFLCVIGIFETTISLIGAYQKKKCQETGKSGNFFTRAYEWTNGSKKSQSFSSPEDALKQKPHYWTINILFFLVLIMLMVYMNLDLNLGSKFVVSIKWDDISDILGKIFRPDWNYFFGIGVDSLGTPYTFDVSVVYQIFQTFGIAFIGTLLASLLALPFGLLASHKLYGRWAWISDIFLILIRTFPELLLGIIMVIAAGSSALTGVIAIGIHSVGMIGKLYAEQFDDINYEPLEGLTASGATSWQKIHLGVIPQAKPGLFSVALYRFDINIRTATVLGVVCGNACGIGFSLSSLNIYTDASKLGACLLGVMILVVAIDLISSWVRKKLV